MVPERRYHVTVKSVDGHTICDVDTLGRFPQDAVVEAMTGEGFDITLKSVVKYIGKSREVATVKLLDGNKHSENYYNILFK